MTSMRKIVEGYVQLRDRDVHRLMPGDRGGARDDVVLCSSLIAVGY